MYSLTQPNVNWSMVKILKEQIKGKSVWQHTVLTLVNFLVMIYDVFKYSSCPLDKVLKVNHLHGAAN